MAAVGCAVATAAVLGIHASNQRRLGGARFERARRALLARAERVRALAGPDYQQRALASLGPGRLSGEVVHLGDRVAEAAWSGAPAHAEAVPRPLLSLEFDSADQVEASPGAPPASLDVHDGMLSTSLAWPAWFTHRQDIALPVDEIGGIELRVRAQQATQLLVGWSTRERTENPLAPFSATVAVDLVPDQRFHVYRIDAKQALKLQTESGQVIRRLYVSPSNVAGDRVEIDYLRVTSRVGGYAARRRGATYEALGGDLRRAVFTVGPGALAWRLRVPARRATLDVGLGVLNGSHPVSFRVAVRAGSGRERRLLVREIAPGSGWHDTALDLSAWAGREVTLSLGARAAPDQVALWASPVLHGPPRRRFNVVLYLEDALRADHLSLFGYARPTSPVKEALARTGVRFSRALSQATQTRPSVPSLMTSLPPSATGVGSFWERLPEPYLTLAEVLRQQGFATAAFVQNPNAGPAAGLHQGFERVVEPVRLAGGTERLLGDGLEGWLARQRDRNFFIYLHALDPHGPYAPPQPFDRWFQLVRGSSRGIAPDSRLDPRAIAAPSAAGRIARYDGEIAHNDSVFTHLLELLDRSGARGDTLIVFLADHGEYLGEQGRWEHEPPGYLPVIHVPLLFVYRDGLPGGRSVAEPVQLMDVMPTILDLAGVDLSRLALAGESLVPWLRGEPAPTLDERMLVSEEPTSLPPRKQGQPCDCGSLFFHDWQLIRSRAAAPEGERAPGFQVLDDSRWPEPPRLAFLLEADALLRHRFRTTVLTWQRLNHEAWRSFTRNEAEDVRLDPAAQQELRALGYVE